MALAFAVAASANLPSILYNMFWRRFNTRGAVWSIYGGLISCGGPGDLLAGRVRQGRPETGKLSLLPTSTSRGSRCENPGIVSIPLGFLLGCLGSVTSKEPEAEERYTELEVRALTGAGAEGAVHALSRPAEPGDDRSPSDRRSGRRWPRRQASESTSH